MLRFITVATFLLVFAINGMAQKNGILPLNGIKYIRNGVWAKKIEVLVNDKTLLSNTVPHNIDFDVKLTEPTGFDSDASGKFYPGIKILLLNAKKDTLGYSPSIFGNKPTPFEKMRFKSLTATLGYNQKVKEGDTVYQFITFFDTRSKNELRLEFPITISYKPDSILTTDNISTASGTKGYNAAATNGIQLKKIEAYLDSTYYPKSLYYNLRSAEMLGITLDEAKAGTFTTWLYDENIKEIVQVKPSQQYFALLRNDGEEINVLVQIALNPIDNKNKKYTARYRWQSKDGMKVIDVMNRFWW